MLKEKKIVILVGFRDNRQLKRLLRFFEKHDFKVYAVEDVEEVKFLKKLDLV